MCEFCMQHGEGKKWYLNIENYLEERLSDEQREFIRELYEGVERTTSEFWASASAMEDPASFVKEAFAGMKQHHWGQVIPREDVEKILDMSLNIIRTPCVCRVALQGLKEYRCCYHVVATPSHFWQNMFDQWPDYSGDLDVVSSGEVKKAFLEHDNDGLVHTVWSYGSPFLGALCNCTPMDCNSMRGLLFGGPRPFFKAEYVAVIDHDACVGCRECFSFCHFGAITYASSSEKCAVRQKECFGCGLCRAACPQEAISIKDRQSIPALINDW